MRTARTADPATPSSVRRNIFTCRVEESNLASPKAQVLQTRFCPSSRGQLVCVHYNTYCQGCTTLANIGLEVDLLLDHHPVGHHVRARDSLEDVTQKRD